MVMSAPVAPLEASTPDLLSSTPDRRLLMLYVHIPFCMSKCHFCDWVARIPKRDLLRRPDDPVRGTYVDALCREVRERGDQLSQAGTVPYVLYWGGGTASSLTTPEIEAVAGAFQEAFDMSSVAESTIECSPDTISEDKLHLFRSLGFTRFSSGVQSLDDARLKLLGRRHTAEQARGVVGLARDAGFADINIDLMCGFPDQPLAEVEKMVAEAVELPITHLSIYPFRPSAGTVMRARVDDGRAHLDIRSQMLAFYRARAIAIEAGFEEYASGYFGRPALNVFMPFQLRLETVGFGSGAVSLLDRRYLAHSPGQLRNYIEDPLRWDVDQAVSDPAVAFSFIRSGLSIFDGILRAEWEHQTGTTLEDVLAQPALRPLMKYLRSSGLIESPRGIRLPPERVARALINLSFHLSLGEEGVRSTQERQSV